MLQVGKKHVQPLKIGHHARLKSAFKGWNWDWTIFEHLYLDK